MKRVFFLLLLGAFVLVSCEKDPNFSDLDEDFIVVTKYDDTYTNMFKTNPNTYYISDTITLLSPDATDPKWCNSLSAELIDRVKSNMKQFGYQYVPYDQLDNEGQFNAQYLLTLTVVKDMETVIYNYYPYWYDYYYWWWWGGYYPYYPYYPYVTGYSYDIGTTLIHMIDMQTAPTTDGRPIRWSAVLGGLLDTGNDKMYEEEAIDQAFTQSSSYLNRN